MVGIIFNVVAIVALIYMLNIDKDSKASIVYGVLLGANILLLVINIIALIYSYNV